MLIPITDIQLIYTKVLKSINIDYISVVIYVAFDVDSICALKIITRILKSQNILYQIFPVSTYTELNHSIDNTRALDKVKMIFFINCGGILDLTEKWFIEQSTQILIFLLDVHKPIHHKNIEHSNIKIIDDGHSEFNNYPTTEEIAKLEQFDQLSLDSDSDESEEEKQPQQQQNDQNQNNHKRKRRKRKQYQHHVKKHKALINKKIADYYGIQYSSVPSSFIAYRLARDINKHNNDLLWYGILGLTYLYIESKITKDVFQKNSELFRSDMLKFNLHIQDDTKQIGTIYQQLDFKFTLLRHWSLYESMLYSPYIVTKMGLWQQKGKKRLNEFLTNIGISLQEANQLYKYMSRQSKMRLKEEIFEKAQKLQLLEIAFNSFSRQVDYSYNLSSSDYCYAIMAALQKPVQSGNHQQTESIRLQNFWYAYEILQKGHLTQILEKIESYKKFLKILITSSISLIQREQIIACNEFLYVKLKNDVPEYEVFQHPHSLIKLGYNLIGIYHQMKRRKIFKPLVIGIQNQFTSICTVAGVVTDTKNKFGKKFVDVAEKNKLSFRQDNFLASIILINKQDFVKFILELNLT